MLGRLRGMSRRRELPPFISLRSGSRRHRPSAPSESAFCNCPTGFRMPRLTYVSATLKAMRHVRSVSIACCALFFSFSDRPNRSLHTTLTFLSPSLTLSVACFFFFFSSPGGQHMGIARFECISGCSCAAIEVDGHHTEKISPRVMFHMKACFPAYRLCSRTDRSSPSPPPPPAHSPPVSPRLCSGDSEQGLCGACNGLGCNQ